MSEKSCNFKDLRKISTISTKSTGGLGVRGLPVCRHDHKETLFFLFFILLLAKPNPPHPKRAVDFVDIVDIFRKPSNHAGLRDFGCADIPWMPTWMWMQPWTCYFFAGGLDSLRLV